MRNQRAQLSKAIDGKTDTFWHSTWTPNQYPYNLTLELGDTRTLSQLAYLPRQDWSENGRILTYNIYTSVDGITYDKISSGTWENNSDKKTATFTPVTAKVCKSGSNERTEWICFSKLK